MSNPLFYKEWFKRSFKGRLTTAAMWAGLVAVILSAIGGVILNNLIPLIVFGAVFIITFLFKLARVPYFIYKELEDRYNSESQQISGAMSTSVDSALTAKAIEKHSEEIRELLRKWKKEVENYNPLGYIWPWGGKVREFEIKIEEDPLFADLINHISPGMDLMKDWQQLKEGTLMNQEDAFALWQSIKAYEEKQLSPVLRYKDIADNSSDVFSPRFINAIYEDVMYLARGDTQPNLGSAHTINRNTTTELFILELRRGGAKIAQTSTEGNANYASSLLNMILKSLSNSDTKESLFADEASKIVEHVKALEELRDTLVGNINELKLRQIFPEECKYTRTT